MLLITCPHCGAAARARVPLRRRRRTWRARPTRRPSTTRRWSEFLFVRNNPKGLYAERWNHAHGCQRWFNALRDTHTDKFVTTYPPPARRAPPCAAEETR